MTDFNTEHNRLVWFDIPVVDLERSVAFYSAVLGCEVHSESYEDFRFGVISHDEGNGGRLVPSPGGGAILEDVHAIGPYGFRAIIEDSEGNRLALHSQVDA